MKLNVEQVRGATKRPTRQVETLRCLGLGKIGQRATLQDTPAIRGMLNKVSHLVRWQESSGSGAAKAKATKKTAKKSAQAAEKTE